MAPGFTAWSNSQITVDAAGISSYEPTSQRSQFEGMSVWLSPRVTEYDSQTFGSVSVPVLVKVTGASKVLPGFTPSIGATFPSTRPAPEPSAMAPGAVPNAISAPAPMTPAVLRSVRRPGAE